MSLSLPDKPSLEHLRKQAKDVLKAQRAADASGCDLLRRLRRFADASDADLLGADVTLLEAQFALALVYGFKDWEDLRCYVRSQRTSDAATLEAVGLRCPHEIPEYAGGGVPLGVVAALNHAGVDIDFLTFAAATGWAFSFGYTYDDISPGFMAVRGNPSADGPFEVFAFLPTRLGFDYEYAETKDHDALWEFVRKHVDARTPIMTEHVDGGLLSGYREHDGRREVLFDGTVAPGWKAIDDLDPYAAYVLVRAREPMDAEQITREALERAVSKGSPHEFRGIPQGLAALNAYLADVSDPAKDFEDGTCWFCWAAFERLIARRACELWLRSVASQVGGRAAPLLMEAADRYGEAYACYDRYRSEVQAGEPSSLGFAERTRSPERIATITPILADGIAAEAAGISALQGAVEAMDA